MDSDGSFESSITLPTRRTVSSTRRKLLETINEEDAPRMIKKRRLEPTKITFHDFRAATIECCPSFAFLGPASMAVYWFKLYLKTSKFGWIHHTNPQGNDRRKKSYFCHIPGQYLTITSEEEDIPAMKTRKIVDVLRRGTPGVHYATSYVGIYNLLRMYGQFGLDQHGDTVLVKYEGPCLPSMLEG